MMMEDLLILLPTPIILPPIIVGVSPVGIGASPWSALTAFPVVDGGLVPEADPAGCVRLWAGCPPVLDWPVPRDWPVAACCRGPAAPVSACGRAPAPPAC